MWITTKINSRIVIIMLSQKYQEESKLIKINLK
jgi:hypothetical protein